MEELDVLGKLVEKGEKNSSCLIQKHDYSNWSKKFSCDEDELYKKVKDLEQKGFVKLTQGSLNRPTAIEITEAGFEFYNENMGKRRIGF